MPKPVIYFAFANDQDAHLALLKEESRELMAALSTRHDGQAIEIHRDESTSVADSPHWLKFTDRSTSTTCP